MKLNYLQNIVFYFLDCIGSFVNFLCSLIKVYPKLELGLEYLMRRQSAFMQNENIKQETRRTSNLKQADEKFTKAKGLVK